MYRFKFPIRNVITKYILTYTNKINKKNPAVSLRSTKKDN